LFLLKEWEDENEDVDFVDSDVSVNQRAFSTD
jgi:hypothetical protein